MFFIEKLLELLLLFDYRDFKSTQIHIFISCLSEYRGMHNITGMRKMIILPKLNDQGGDLSKKWFVFYSYRNPKTDKMQQFRIYKGLKECKSRKTRYRFAEKIISELSRKLKQGWNPIESDEDVIYEDNLMYNCIAKEQGRLRKSKRTIDVLLSGFMDHQKNKISKKTYQTYLSKIRRFSKFLKSCNRNNDISEIKPSDLYDFFSFLNNDLKIVRVTYLNYRQKLNEFFEYLRKTKVIHTNPFKLVELPDNRKVADEAAKPFNEKLLQVLTEEIKKDPELWLAVQLEFYCYIRPKEIRFLKVKDFELYSGVITIPPDISKNGKKQSVAIPRDFLHQLVEVYELHKYPEDYYVIGKDQGGRPGKKHYGHNYLGLKFRRIRKKLNIPEHYKLYSFKHTGAIMASNAGIPVKDIQMQMRHHSLDVTDKYLAKMRGVDSDAIKYKFPKL